MKACFQSGKTNQRVSLLLFHKTENNCWTFGFMKCFIRVHEEAICVMFTYQMHTCLVLQSPQTQYLEVERILFMSVLFVKWSHSDSINYVVGHTTITLNCSNPHSWLCYNSSSTNVSAHTLMYTKVFLLIVNQ